MREAFDRVAAAIDGTPVMTREQGGRIWEHAARHRPVDVLDIGTAHGASAAYLAGALAFLGRGRVVTVDSAQFDDRSPAAGMARQLFERVGVADRVEMVRIPHSDYAWWLLDAVRRRDRPRFDFVYLDGAKTFALNAASVVLIEQLLHPGGWLLMDDLRWTYGDHPHFAPSTVHPDGSRYELSAEQLAAPQLRAVFDHVVRAHPGFGQTYVDMDGWWGWARKSRAAGLVTAAAGAERRARRGAGRVRDGVRRARRRGH